jgi:hypothetical protein
MVDTEPTRSGSRQSRSDRKCRCWDETSQIVEEIPPQNALRLPLSIRNSLFVYQVGLRAYERNVVIVNDLIT